MSNESQTSSQSSSKRLLTKDERELFNFLKKGPRRNSEIWKHLKEKGISKPTFNRMLNRNEKDHRIFRIKRGEAVFYQINDFPLNVKALLVLLDHIIKEKELAMIEPPAKKEGESFSESIARRTFQILYEIPKNKEEMIFCQTLKRNIIRLYPKLDLRKISQLNSRD